MSSTTIEAAAVSAVKPAGVAVMASIAVVMGVVVMMWSVDSRAGRKNLSTRRAAGAPRRPVPAGPSKSQHDHDQEQREDYTERRRHVLYLRFRDVVAARIIVLSRRSHCGNSS